ncbi:MAG: aminopeptidase P family protein [Thermoplasmata archaeon]
MAKSVSRNRAARLFSLLDDSIDAVLVCNSHEPYYDDNFRYLTDAHGGAFEGDCALVTRRGVTILTSLLEQQIAKRTGARVIIYGSQKEFESKFADLLKGISVLGISPDRMTLSAVKLIRKHSKGVKLRDISKQLKKCRMVKDEIELSRIKKAAAIASKVADSIPDVVKVGMTERQAAAEVDYLLKSTGADDVAFSSIVAFGKSSSIPHYQPGARKLGRGSVALFDFGARYRNYGSDITRTYFTKPIDRKMEEVFDIVLEAQSAAIRMIRADIKAKTIDSAARKVIEDAGYGKQFIHSTGHGLGISTHDPGRISKGSKDVLRENMVLTVEPGIYLPGRGGVRIEDDVIVRKDRAEVITRAAREIVFL